MIGRRDFLRLGGAAAASAMAFRIGAMPAEPVFSRERELRARLAAIEREGQGRLGVALRDSGDGRYFDWRGDERFPMCSTFKFLLAAAVLQSIDRGRTTLQARLPIAARDLIDNSPFSRQHVGGRGGSIAELCEATLIWSDNTAANLLLPLVGGPAGLTRFARGIGDPATRLDRNEPALNTAIPGDPRDTTTPAAMCADLQRILAGDVLGADSRRQLTAWMADNRTGATRLKGGLPADWRIADKTGSNGDGDGGNGNGNGGNGNGTTNDIGIVWPPGRPPLLLACYFTGTPLDSDARDEVLKAVAKAVAGSVAASRPGRS